MAIYLESAGPTGDEQPRRRPGRPRKDGAAPKADKPKPDHKAARKRAAAKGRKYSPKTPEVSTVDPGVVEKLASFQCTNAEIADFVGLTERVLALQFSDDLARGRNKGKATLRRMQWEAARKGSAAMLIWLGKQYLGQVDTPEPGGAGNDADGLTTLFRQVVASTYGGPTAPSPGTPGEQPGPP